MTTDLKKLNDMMKRAYHPNPAERWRFHVETCMDAREELERRLTMEQIHEDALDEDAYRLLPPESKEENRCAHCGHLL